MNIAQEASNVLDQLLGDFKSKFADIQRQQGVVDAFTAFAAAVDWRVSHCTTVQVLPVMLHPTCLWTASISTNIRLLCRNLG